MTYVDLFDLHLFVFLYKKKLVFNLLFLITKNDIYIYLESKNKVLFNYIVYVKYSIIFICIALIHMKFKNMFKNLRFILRIN